MDFKQGKTSSDVFKNVDISDNKEYRRNTVDTKRENDELEIIFKDLNKYGSNEHYFRTHHQIMLQEEVVLTMFKKIQE